MERLAAYVTLSSGFKRFLIALIAGALTALSQPPFGFFVINFATFPVLLWLVDGAASDPERGFVGRHMPAFGVGWTFGLGYFVAGIWWTGSALLVDADMFAWALPLAIVGLPAYLALFYGLATFAARLVWSDGAIRLLTLGAAFGLGEWLRGWVLTGFPWNAIGYSMTPYPVMMQSLSITGTDLMNALAVVVFAAPGLLMTGRGAWMGVTCALALMAVHLGFGAWRLNGVAYPTTSSQRIVRLVQPYIDQAAKVNDNERARIFETHLKLTAAPPLAGGRRPDYIIWPETSIPFIVTRNPDSLVQIANTLEDGQMLLAGALRTESDSSKSEPRYYNSIYMIDSQGQIIAAADKVHLVPFGEYLPLEGVWNRIGLRSIAAEMPGGYSAAANHQILTMPDGAKVLPLICYEVIFPNEVADEAEKADMIVNITNDGWFGFTPGPWQHFHQARLAAVETGLPLIRNSNSGISAVVDGYGRIINGMDYGTVGFIDAAIPPKIVPLLNASQREFNFGLFEFLTLVASLISRMSFIFRRN